MSELTVTDQTTDSEIILCNKVFDIATTRKFDLNTVIHLAMKAPLTQNIAWQIPPVCSKKACPVFARVIATASTQFPFDIQSREIAQMLKGEAPAAVVKKYVEQSAFVQDVISERASLAYFVYCFYSNYEEDVTHYFHKALQCGTPYVLFEPARLAFVQILMDYARETNS